MWIWIAGLPKRGNYALFTVEVPTRVLLRLSLRADGKLELLQSLADNENTNRDSGTPRPFLTAFIKGETSEFLVAFVKNMFSEVEASYVRNLMSVGSWNVPE